MSTSGGGSSYRSFRESCEQKMHEKGCNLDPKNPRVPAFSGNFSSCYPHDKGGPARGKCDGVIGHISKRENGNWMNKLRYCVID